LEKHPDELQVAIAEAFAVDGPAIVDCVVAADELPNMFAGAGSIELKRTRLIAMPKFANVVTIEVAQGRRDQLLPLLAAHKARSLKDEPGTLQFEILLPKDDDTKVVSYEVYRDDTAFEIHRNGPSLARLREEIAGMVVKLHGTRCAVVD